jgi:hypothetical protein
VFTYLVCFNANDDFEICFQFSEKKMFENIASEVAKYFSRDHSYKTLAGVASFV